MQEFSRVYAPFAGTITARNVEIGQLPTNGNGAARRCFISRSEPGKHVRQRAADLFAGRQGGA